MAVTLHHADIGETRPAALAGDIAAAVARTCRHAYDIGKPQPALHESVKHADGEDAAHAATLKHKAHVTCMFYSWCHFTFHDIWQETFRIPYTHTIACI